MTTLGGLQYQRYGTPGGFPVVLHHGLVGSATVSPQLCYAARAQGVELICIARPGYGLSQPVEMRCVADWYRLVQPLLDELDIDRYGVWGVSAGAPYAYALGALDERVNAVAITSGLGYLPDPRVVDMYDEPSKQAFAYFRTGSDDDVRRYWLDELRRSLAGQAPGSDWTMSLLDSVANDGAGPGREAVLQQRPWGFELSSITAPVRMWHSRDDQLVPYATAQWTKSLIPGAIMQNQAEPDHVPSRDTIRAAMVFLSLRAQYPARRRLRDKDGSHGSRHLRPDGRSDALHVRRRGAGHADQTGNRTDLMERGRLRRSHHQP